jgi:hypothetical protein
MQSLHAGVAAEAWERSKLERLCRYITRPAVSEKRLSLTPAFIAKTLFNPTDFMKLLWSYIDKSSGSEVAIFVDIIRESPSISIKEIYEIVKCDLLRIKSELTLYDPKHYFNGTRVQLTDRKRNNEGDLNRLLSVKFLICLYNVISAKQYSVVDELCLPGSIYSFLITYNNTNRLYDLRCNDKRYIVSAKETTSIFPPRA